MPTIPEETKLRQVGGNIGNTGKDSLDAPLSQAARKYDGAAWQIPPGVTKGNWDYVRAGQIASAYDDFLKDDPLTEVDWQILNRYLPAVDSESNSNHPIVADFGCGTGRSLEPLLNRGYRGLAVDLSIPMLQKFAEKIEKKPQIPSKLLCVQANLVELDGIASCSVDHAVCMFSTLGMIEGACHRKAFLDHVRRIVKPGGLFILHAHNSIYQLTHRRGLRWGIKSVVSHLIGKSEFGDRTATYRGVNNMFIHSFRKRELTRSLSQSGFVEEACFGIVPERNEPIEKFPLFHSLKLTGWITVCK